jgi:hypothetical protein
MSLRRHPRASQCRRHVGMMQRKGVKLKQAPFSSEVRWPSWCPTLSVWRGDTISRRSPQMTMRPVGCALLLWLASAMQACHSHTTRHPCLCWRCGIWPDIVCSVFLPWSSRFRAILASDMSMRRNTVKMKAWKIRVADYYRRKEKQDAKWVKKRMWEAEELEAARHHWIDTISIEEYEQTQFSLSETEIDVAICKVECIPIIESWWGG